MKMPTEYLGEGLSSPHPHIDLVALAGNYPVSIKLSFIAP